MRCPLLVLCACTGGHTTDIAPTLSFSDVGSDAIQRLIGAAQGQDIQAAVGRLYSQPGDPCPVATKQGTTTTFAGGCTTEQAVVVGGSAEVTTMAEEPDRGTWRAWTLSTSGDVERFDGRATWQVALALLGADADLTATITGIAVRSDIAFSCDPLPGCDNECVVRCTPTGSGVELVGAGGALVSGYWDYEVMVGASLVDWNLTLQGVDTLVSTKAGYTIMR